MVAPAHAGRRVVRPDPARRRPAAVPVLRRLDRRRRGHQLARFGRVPRAAGQVSSPVRGVRGPRLHGRGDTKTDANVMSNEEEKMALQLGDTAPDFEVDSTEGRIRFHDWIGDSWGILFSHPKDFTPVCTTELGYMAKIKPEFDRRGVKIIGLSVDATGEHERWVSDIEETQGYAPNYPIIGDADFRVSKLYGMLPAETSGEAKT